MLTDCEQLDGSSPLLFTYFDLIGPIKKLKLSNWVLPFLPTVPGTNQVISAWLITLVDGKSQHGSACDDG